MENECLLSSSVTQMMLSPSYSSGIDYLLGIQTGRPLKRGRKQAASRVLLDYLRKNVDPKRALTQCGTFDPQALDPRIIELVRHEAPLQNFIFEVEQF